MKLRRSTSVAILPLALIAAVAVTGTVRNVLHPVASVYPTTYTETHPVCAADEFIKIYKGVEVCARN